MATIKELIEPGKHIGIGDKGEIVRLIQLALLKAGHQLVPDGEFGHITEAAVTQYQAAHNFAPVGYVGPKTAMAFDAILKSEGIQDEPLASVFKPAPHLATMRAISGTKEVPGAKDSPIIMSWSGIIARAYPELASYSRGYIHDSIPWCGLTTAFCLASNKLRPVNEYLWAANWGAEGSYLVRLKAPYPQGAIMVYTRAGGGHVSLLEESGEGWDNIRGGNQSDMVNVVAKSREAFSHATWPRGLPIPSSPAPRAKVKGKVSGSEV